jgi:hypothetical protein
MELISGGSLARCVGDYRDNPRGAAVLVEKIARAVHALHLEHIIHRDLKPANILLDKDGEPLVGDFGLAKTTDRPADQTQPGQLVGTVAYMAPEQAAGHTWKVSARSDVWALGVILYELLTEQRPFPGKEVEAVARLVLTSEPASPRRLNPAVSQDLDAIVRKCLVKEPEQRYVSAEALADDLARWLRGERRPRESLLQRLGRGAPRGRVLACAGGILSVVLAATLLFQTKPQPVPPPPTEIVFLGPNGLIAPPTWPVQEGALTFEEGALRLDGKGMVLAELLAHVPWRSYQFDAEVMDLGESSVEVGLYVAHNEQKTQAAAEHWFATLGFSETPPPESKTRRDVHLKFQGFRDGLANPTSYHLNGSRTGALDLRARPTWRKLSLLVKQGMLRACYDDREDQVITLVKDDALRIAKARRRKQFESEPTLAAQEGLGLYCHFGVAQFKNLRVCAVPEEN